MKINTNYNIDYHEKNKFDLEYMQWWDKNGIFKILHQINSFRLEYILNCSNGLFKKNILDIGCGGGILSESMANEGANVTGIDIGENTIQIAQKHAIKNKIHINYICETIEEHAIKNFRKYDIITCMELLEHIPNPLSTILACSQTIKINGHIFFSTLNRTFKSWIVAIIGAEYILHILPKKTHTFKKFIKPSELLNWLDIARFQGENIIGLSYNPICKKFTLNKKIDTNYILHGKRI